MIRCGICDKEVDDWDKHAKSKEHLENINNFEHMDEVFKKHCKDNYRDGEEK